MQSIGDLIPGVLAGLNTPETLAKSKLLNQWPSIAGPQIAPHTKPSLGSKQTLFVWVDQPALAFELNQKYRQSILKRVQAVLGEEAVAQVRFLVGQLR